MLSAYPRSEDAEATTAARKVSWLDLLNPTEEERASVESKYGLQLPSREELSEVELSSRISESDGVLYLSIPTITHVKALDQPPSPVGFVLSSDLLVTIHYTPLRSFETVAAKFSGADGRTSVETFAALIDEMVDLSADVLEEIAAELDALSRVIFPKLTEGHRHLKSNEALRDVLTEVGLAGERMSRIRDVLLGLQRIVPFVSGTDRGWIPQKIQIRLKTAQNDLLSLTEYETHLSDKVQFLLDAVLGFINTTQNDIFRVLTIVSVIGIPPTLVASMYGMNFKNMPELSWAWGYQYGLALIVLSIAVPILWFKRKGWL